MDRLIIRPCKSEDIIPIAENISKFDRKDIEGTSPEINLAYGIHHSSICLTIQTPKGKPLGMFGVLSSSDDKATPWMLTTEELVTTYRIQFMREGRKWADWLLTKYPILMNLIPTDHEHKWLTWVGYKDHGIYSGLRLMVKRKN